MTNTIAHRQQVLDCISSNLHPNPYLLFVEELLETADETLLLKLSSTATGLRSRLSSDCSRSPDPKERPGDNMQRKRKKPSHDNCSAMRRFFDGSDLVSHLFSFLQLDTHHILAQTSRSMMSVAGVPLPVQMRARAPCTRKHLKLSVQCFCFTPSAAVLVCLLDLS
jgi:hypothetical protein